MSTLFTNFTETLTRAATNPTDLLLTIAGTVADVGAGVPVEGAVRGDTLERVTALATALGRTVSGEGSGFVSEYAAARLDQEHMNAMPALAGMVRGFTVRAITFNASSAVALATREQGVRMLLRQDLLRLVESPDHGSEPGLEELMVAASGSGDPIHEINLEAALDSLGENPDLVIP